ncbi:competence type IV pilus major pilin ComGC [Atopobacter sp. AH10]|uniref:competence type IV pilus major pilin ComGC n=1 Tax=Atopobacter sp. AH10 TaxID=2315861 RepID=UPI001F309307|nr:competence type IV pilus major pilin ComGC [Atopobacter sp. AH10]
MKKRFLALKKRGFTLLEMVIVMFVVGILMLLFIPNLSAQRARIAKKGDAALTKVFETQKEVYLLENTSTDAVTPEVLFKAKLITEDQKKKMEEKGIQ